MMCDGIIWKKDLRPDDELTMKHLYRHFLGFWDHQQAYALVYEAFDKHNSKLINEVVGWLVVWV